MWVITKVAKGSGLEQSEVGTMGPSGSTLPKEEILKNGQSFKMYDGDGNLYYTGKCVHDGGEDTVFAPLDDFGRPNAGCTEIRYKNSAGEYETV